MVQPHFIVAPVGLGALVLQRTFRRKKGPRDDEVKRRDGDGDGTVCYEEWERMLEQQGEMMVQWQQLAFNTRTHTNADRGGRVSIRVPRPFRWV